MQKADFDQERLFKFIYAYVNALPTVGTSIITVKLKDNKLTIEIESDTRRDRSLIIGSNGKNINLIRKITESICDFYGYRSDVQVIE